jgi:short-subunit dehydrogenase
MKPDTEFLKHYGPTAVVTGASSGIGEAFAALLAARGFDLVLVARRDERLQTLAGDLMAKHEVAITVCCADLSQPAAIDHILAATEGMDVGLLVSNAGFGLKGAHHLNEPQRMTDMLTVNCQVPMQLCHRFIPQMRSRGRGGILLTSSVEALLGFPYSGAYAASKAFVNSLAESLWGELNEHGIDVLALCPGSTDTEAHALQGIDQSMLENMMSPEEVALLGLENLANGPIYIAGETNEQVFTGLAAMPRRDALLILGANMRDALKKPE